MGLNKKALIKTLTPNLAVLLNYIKITVIMSVLLTTLMSVSLGIVWLLVTLLGGEWALRLVIGAAVLVYFIILVVEPVYERYKRYDSIQE